VKKLYVIAMKNSPKGEKHCATLCIHESVVCERSKHVSRSPASAALAVRVIKMKLEEMQPLRIVCCYFV